MMPATTRRLLSLGSLLALCGLLVATVTTPAFAVTIPTVPVGDAGNTADVRNGRTIGAVAYNYQVGTTEVTNAQYAEFLNAKAAVDDDFGLYNDRMRTQAHGGITRSGTGGNYSYTPKANMADKPVNYVSWFDAVRFVNWLNNGQGAGDTETGAYTILGGTPTPSNLSTISRNPGATWFLPSDDEWYKAAYYDPTLAGGTGGYWEYPTQSNSAPTVATANSVGDISNPGANVANCLRGAEWNGQVGNVTTVGSAGPSSESYYGTSDQGGNLIEWNDTLFSGGYRGLLGGAWASDLGFLAAPTGVDYPTDERAVNGFRVATIPVPEPSTNIMAAFGRRRPAHLGPPASVGSDTSGWRQANDAYRHVVDSAFSPRT